MEPTKPSYFETLSLWEEAFSASCLPTWDELPDLDLYMDQVVSLLSSRIAPFLEDKPLTSSAINNYVCTRLMPPPKKKRYNRIHLAYLIVICTLRHSMSMAAIEQILPLSLSEAECKTRYDEYVRQYCSMSRLLSGYLSAALNTSESHNSDTPPLPVATAILSSLTKLLTSHLLAQHAPAEAANTKKKESSQ